MSAASQSFWFGFAKRVPPALGAGALPFLLLSYSGGPPVKRTGAPGERTCLDANCHVGERVEASASVSLDTGGGALTYAPGGPRQRWILRNSDSAARAYGMQLSVRAASDPARLQAGDLFSVDATTSVICEDERFKGVAGCLPTAPIQFIHHTEPRRQGVFEMEWTPPSTNLGDLSVYVAFNASVTGQRNSRIHFRTFRLTPAAAAAPPVSVVSAAGFLPVAAAAPHTWIAVFGSALSATTRAWREGDFREGTLPASLDGVEVRVNGRAAAVAFVSPSQVNALLPDLDASLAAGSEVRMEVRRDGVLVGSALARAGRVAPAFFAARPEGAARAGSIVSLYGTGFGPTNPPVPTGRVFSGAAPCADPVSIRVGGVPAEVQFAGLISPGVYQFNVVIPSQLPAGEHPVEAEVGGVRTPSTGLHLDVAR